MLKFPDLRQQCGDMLNVRNVGRRISIGEALSLMQLGGERVFRERPGSQEGASE